MEKTYWLIALSPESENMVENLIRPFCKKGFKVSNVFILITDESIDDVHQFIKENKPDSFVYLLTDMTNNMSSETFKAVLNEKYYRYTGLLSKYIQQFRAEDEDPMKGLSTQQYQDILLDKINKKGVDSLTEKEKEFLKNLK